MNMDSSADRMRPIWLRRVLFDVAVESTNQTTGVNEWATALAGDSRGARFDPTGSRRGQHEATDHCVVHEVRNVQGARRYLKPCGIVPFDRDRIQKREADPAEDFAKPKRPASESGKDKTCWGGVVLELADAQVNLRAGNQTLERDLRWAEEHRVTRHTVRRSIRLLSSNDLLVELPNFVEDVLSRDEPTVGIDDHSGTGDPAGWVAIRQLGRNPERYDLRPDRLNGLLKQERLPPFGRHPDSSNSVLGPTVRRTRRASLSVVHKRP